MRSPAGLDSYLCLFLRSRKTNGTTVRICEPSLPPKRTEPREGLCLAHELPLLSLRHRSLPGSTQKPGLGASSSCRGNYFSAQREHHAMQRQPEEGHGCLMAWKRGKVERGIKAKFACNRLNSLWGSSPSTRPAHGFCFAFSKKRNRRGVPHLAKPRPSQRAGKHHSTTLTPTSSCWAPRPAAGKRQFRYDLYRGFRKHSHRSSILKPVQESPRAVISITAANCFKSCPGLAVRGQQGSSGRHRCYAKAARRKEIYREQKLSS
ncbi:hypothetical protein Anapl_16814 [Anas platyrhynchos]|uniref:Uncharacterized protein n=1 Tax=Anas platyrhynchos TaxID=8839 RepID=R0KWH0_ANAPL|nr:hypothetical protein Anapl_16814 [Anas platyrhynchos]